MLSDKTVQIVKAITPAVASSAETITRRFYERTRRHRHRHETTVFLIDPAPDIIESVSNENRMLQEMSRTVWSRTICMMWCPSGTQLRWGRRVVNLPSIPQRQMVVRWSSSPVESESRRCCRWPNPLLNRTGRRRSVLFRQRGTVVSMRCRRKYVRYLQTAPTFKLISSTTRRLRTIWRRDAATTMDSSPPNCFDRRHLLLTRISISAGRHRLWRACCRV